jgi:queuine tRNA-ribosyltransferase
MTSLLERPRTARPEHPDQPDQSTQLPQPEHPDQPGGRSAFSFETTTRLPDSAQGKGRGGARYGRTGVIHTPHGDITTPAFVPVATQAAMKAVLPEQMRELGAQCLLSNAFHLFERPGEDVLDEAGGLSRFMNWDGPTFTDSGGFRCFPWARGSRRRSRWMSRA